MDLWYPDLVRVGLVHLWIKCASCWQLVARQGDSSEPPESSAARSNGTNSGGLLLGVESAHASAANERRDPILLALLASSAWPGGRAGASEER